MKTKIGLLYGGKSAEHKVSLQTALAVTKALDFNKFDIFPVYITVDGQWVAGKQLMGPAQTVEELKLRAGIGKSTAELLQKAGCLKGMMESNQMSLFAM